MSTFLHELIDCLIDCWVFYAISEEKAYSVVNLLLLMHNYIINLFGKRDIELGMNSLANFLGYTFLFGLYSLM